jgi:hypothetical protein
MSIPKECFLIVNKSTHSIFGIHTSKTTKLISFVKKPDATKCINMIAKFKKHHGIWPLIKNQKIIISQSKNPKKNEVSSESLSAILQEMEIQYADTDDLIGLCNMQNIGMVFCNDFIIDSSNMHFKGCQFEPPENLEIITEYLETLL